MTMTWIEPQPGHRIRKIVGGVGVTLIGGGTSDSLFPI